MFKLFFKNSSNETHFIPSYDWRSCKLEDIPCMRQIVVCKTYLYVVFKLDNPFQHYLKHSSTLTQKNIWKNMWNSK